MPGFAPDQLLQAINPWSWWFKSSDNVNGLINITQYKSANPDAEQKIIQEVAGYGMQLGKVEGMIALMMQFIPKQQLTKEQKETVESFECMLREIEEKKEQVVIEQLSAGGVDQLIANLALLKEKHPERYASVAKRLKAVL